VTKTKQHIVYSDVTEQTARFAKALSHPIRLAILKYLDTQNCCYTGELVEILPMAQSTISQHLKELKDAGLIEGNITPPRVKYCINKNNWEKAKRLFEALFNKNFTSISCC
jgi:DNA-binding transcriptional ArsR family regulator